MALLPFLAEISVAAAGNTPEEKIDSIVKQLNEWQRQFNQTTSTFKSESWMPMHPQWTDSWTATLNTWVDVEGSLNQIDFEDWSSHNFYFEMIGKTDAGTGYWRLYNITDSEAIEGSEISTTSTSAARIRSGIIAKPRGTKEIKLQHKITGGDGSTEFVNSMMSRIVFRIDT